MPQRQVPVMRAATSGERFEDVVRDLYEGAAAQPLGQILDLLGLSDLEGMADTFTDPDYRDALKTGMAPRRVPVSAKRYEGLVKKFGGGTKPPPAPRIGGGGERIPRNSQAGVGTPEENMAKIPRFRSEHGTFIKHEGQWWRVKEQPAGNVYNRGEQGTVLELLEPGAPAPGTVPKILQTKVVDADDLISGIREAKGVREPKRQVAPKFDK